MADYTNDTKKDGTVPVDHAAAKRPYATLDLRATEIKVTSLGDKVATATGSTPRPAAASSYADESTAMSNAAQKPEAKMHASNPQSAPADKALSG